MIRNTWDTCDTGGETYRLARVKAGAECLRSSKEAVDGQ